jgi:hypothetical protein
MELSKTVVGAKLELVSSEVEKNVQMQALSKLKASMAKVSAE